MNSHCGGARASGIFRKGAQIAGSAGTTASFEKLTLDLFDRTVPNQPLRVVPIFGLADRFGR